MSRSRKKHPYVPWCCVGKGSAMRSAKREANRRLRRHLNEHLDTEYSKKPKLFEERYYWPDDGKMRYEHPKSYRK